MSFLTKLLSLLQLRKLPPRYNVIPFLTVHDPETDVKSTVFIYHCQSDHILKLCQAASYISGTFKKMNSSRSISSLLFLMTHSRHLFLGQRAEHFELIFIRLLHLLAHHPDFNTTHDDLLDVAKFVSIMMIFDISYSLISSSFTDMSNFTSISSSLQTTSRFCTI